MKSVQHERIKILVTETLIKAKVCVLNKRISLNQHIMIKKNLNNDVMIRNSLNQCEVLEKISNLCNVTADTPSDLCVKQKTDLNSLDQPVFTENFHTDLSRKMKKKDLNSTEFTQENSQKINLSRSTDTADVQQLVSSSLVINIERKTAYMNMSITELIQTIYRQQELNFQVFIVC